jgi:flagellar biosynthesis protein FlhF
VKVRTFYAASMQEAITAIKQELGADAVILSTRRVRKWGNAFGMLGSSALEVMAAVEEELADQADAIGEKRPAQGDVFTGMQGSAEPSFERSFQVALNRGAQPAAPSVRSKGSPTDVGALSRSLQGLYQDLISQGIRRETASCCLHELQNTLRDPDRTASHFMLQLLRGVLMSGLRSAGPLLAADDCQKLVLFVGPSGVGKTTTIAKLAAQYRLEQKRSVAMVTIDNYRPAAVEQLRLYANVLGVELATASTCDEARDAICQLGQPELVLVDTPGFNPRHEEPWNGWTALAGLPYQIEVHLVLSATTRIQDIDAAVQRCLGAPSLRLLFTKLDETCGYGSIFEAGHHSGIPLSYWGTGPRVPEDLSLAAPDRLIDLVLGATVPVKENPAEHAAGDRDEAQPLRPRQTGGRVSVQSVSVTSAREHQHE